MWKEKSVHAVWTDARQANENTIRDGEREDGNKQSVHALWDPASYLMDTELEPSKVMDQTKFKISIKN